eukprot:31177-Pelagococcus_subviridis.AAC.13
MVRARVVPALPRRVRSLSRVVRRARERRRDADEVGARDASRGVREPRARGEEEPRVVPEEHARVPARQVGDGAVRAVIQSPLVVKLRRLNRRATTACFVAFFVAGAHFETRDVAHERDGVRDAVRARAARRHEKWSPGRESGGLAPEPSPGRDHPRAGASSRGQISRVVSSSAQP